MTNLDQTFKEYFHTFVKRPDFVIAYKKTKNVVCEMQAAEYKVIKLRRPHWSGCCQETKQFLSVANSLNTPLMFLRCFQRNKITLPSAMLPVTTIYESKCYQKRKLWQCRFQSTWTPRWRFTNGTIRLTRIHKWHFINSLVSMKASRVLLTF